MRIIIEKNYSEEERPFLTEIYYNFFLNLNGQDHFFPFLKFLTKKDFNKNLVEKVLKELTEENIYLLKVVDENNKILAVSRFKTTEYEIIVAEILVSDLNLERLIKKFVINEYEELVKKNNVTELCLEIPWFDRTYYEIAVSLNYEGQNIYDIDNNVDRTILLSKKFVKNRGL
ncbi:MAG: hypothetical protein E7172_05685 [Firmicutes bacterium]|nr:hypothetical protein [Bacillota bacterium]